jgi:hypothetical protein
MAAQDDMLDLQHVDRELDHRHEVQVVLGHQVRDVAVDEEPARARLGELIGRDAAVGAADPQELGLLPGDLAGEEFRIVVDLLGRPRPVGEHELLIILHAKRTSWSGALIWRALRPLRSPFTTTERRRNGALWTKLLMMSILSTST